VVRSTAGDVINRDGGKLLRAGHGGGDNDSPDNPFDGAAARLGIINRRE
jgi:hypothetical protein